MQFVVKGGACMQRCTSILERGHVPRSAPLALAAICTFFSLSSSNRMASTSRAAVRSLGRRSFHSSGQMMEQRTQNPRRVVEVGQMQLNRLEEHYNSTLVRDLLYMNYHHPSQHNAEQDTQTPSGREWDLTSPYSKNRPSRPNRGNRMDQPSATDDVVKLERIVITAFCKEAIINKNALIPLLAQMRAITGKPVLGSLADPNAFRLDAVPKHGHIEIVRSKSGIASFKLRAGMPIGVKTVLPSKPAYEFLEILTTFVLPRLRSFNGFLLPPSSQPSASPAATCGVVSLGMKPDAMSLFPQTEVNWDAYPSKSVGFQVSLVPRPKRA